jgi:two-component system, sensor histidine kinase and response regulator
MGLASASASKSSILVVDDAPDNLRLLSEVLTRQGYDVRSAISGSIALMVVPSIYPDLILLDINMPQMDGYQVCELLKLDSQTREIPVIFLSAMGETIDKVRAFEVGAVDYITKPFQIQEVIVRIENQLNLRRMRVELSQALVKEQELNRLKSEFISMVSHDFRTPLCSIQGFAELLRHYGQDLSTEKQDQYFDRINASVEHLIALLDEVLLIGSFEVGKIKCRLTSIHLASFCQELVETFQLSISHSHEIQLSLAETIQQFHLETDLNLLRQVFSNLLSNAVKYSPNQTAIQLDLQYLNQQIIFRVIDRGIGIPADNLPFLFDSFYRCTNVGEIKGTGLGLAIVQRCVDTLGGKIQVESNLGQGTTFTVTFPETGALNQPLCRS